VSCFKAVHGRHPGATHLDHAGASAPVDAVFWRQGLKGINIQLANGYAAEGQEVVTCDNTSESPPLVLQPVEAFLLPLSASDDCALSRPIPQTKDTLDWLAAQQQQQTAKTAPNPAMMRVDVAGGVQGVCSLLSVPPIVDSPSNRSATTQVPSTTSTGAHVTGTGTGTGTGAAGVSSEASGAASTPAASAYTPSATSSAEGANILTTVCSSKAEHGPWCTDPTSQGGLSRAQSMANVLNGVAVEYTGAFAVTRPLSELSLTDWCNLSDHRPLIVTFEVLGR
jgi:hypothetical protein